MTELLKRHPNYASKVQQLPVEIHVRINRQWANTPYPYGFYILRHDGTWMDFSYKECISPEPHASRFARACREACATQTTEYKRRHVLQLCCALSGKPFVFGEERHVDHYNPTFNELIFEFIETENILPETTKLASDGNREGSLVTFLDESLRQRFSDFHQDRAHLRLVTKQSNLSRKRKPTDPAARRSGRSKNPRHHAAPQIQQIQDSAPSFLAML